MRGLSGTYDDDVVTKRQDGVQSGELGGGQGGTKGLATVVIVEISLSTESGKVNVAEIFSRVEIVCLEGLR